MPVGQRASLAPPPPRPWRRSSVPVGRRSAPSPPSPSDQHCSGEQLPGPWPSTAAHALAWHAVVALVVAGQLPRAARCPFSRYKRHKRKWAHLREMAGGGGWWWWCCWWGGRRGSAGGEEGRGGRVVVVVVVRTVCMTKMFFHERQQGNCGSPTVFSTTAPVELAPPAIQGDRPPCPRATAEFPWSPRPWGNGLCTTTGR